MRIVEVNHQEEFRILQLNLAKINFRIRISKFTQIPHRRIRNLLVIYRQLFLLQLLVFMSVKAIDLCEHNYEMMVSQN